MINLIVCNKENFVKLLKLMQYKIDKNKKDSFIYMPQKISKNKIKNNMKFKKNTPFDVLSEIRFK